MNKAKELGFVIIIIFSTFLVAGLVVLCAYLSAINDAIFNAKFVVLLITFWANSVVIMFISNRVMKEWDKKHTTYQIVYLVEKENKDE